MREHDPEKNAERLRRLNQEQGEPLHRSQEQFQKSSRPMQAPGRCRVCRREGCSGIH